MNRKRKDGRAFMAQVIDAAAETFRNGDSTKSQMYTELARKMGVSRGQLYHWLKRTYPSTLQVRHALQLAELARIDVKEFVNG